MSGRALPSLISGSLYVLVPHLAQVASRFALLFTQKLHQQFAS